MAGSINSRRHENETAPLLGRKPSSTSCKSDHEALLEPDTIKQPRSWLHLPAFDTIHPRYRFVPLLGCLMILFNEAEYFLKQAATMRAIESLYCIEYYNEHDPAISHKYGKHIPERLCKPDVVEQQVAQTWAWFMLVRMTCATIGAIPLGRLADTKGRWSILLMHKIGVAIAAVWPSMIYLLYPRLPIWTMYFGGMGALVGGNFDLGLAVLFASYTDVMPNAAQRTTLFFLTTSMQYIAQVGCPSIGGLLMNLDGDGGTPLVAMGAGLSMSLLLVPLVLFCYPETKDASAEAGPSDRSPDGQRHDQTSAPQDSSGRSIKGSANSGARTWIEKLNVGLDGIGFVNAFALGLSIFMVSIGLKAIDWFGLVQYPVVKLRWSYSQAANTPAFQAVICMILFFAILPTSTSVLSNRMHFSARATALIIMSASLCCLILGCLLMGLASTAVVFLIALALYTLGSGFGVTAQSYIANCVRTDKLASVLAVLSIANTAGKVGASALWPPLLSAGLRSGTGIGKGLPMFAAAIGFAIASLGVMIVACRGDRQMRHASRENPATDTIS